MTTDDKNGIPDAEFEAFLKGEDELSHRLKAMPQPSPSAEQDAVILKRVKFALAQERRPAAANDAAPAGFNRRWRVPVGIAAALVAGVLAHQTWQVGSETDKVAETPYSPPPAADAAPKAASDGARLRMEAAPAPTPVLRAPVPRAPTVAKPAPATPASTTVPGAPGHPLAATQLPAPAAPATAPAPEQSLQSPPQPMSRYGRTVDTQRAASPQIASEPPLVAGSPRADGSMSISVSGSRNRVEDRRVAIPEKTTPRAWLDLIDEMLKAGLPRDALDEWSKFRLAYPDYPVPEPLAERIKAIQK